MDEIRRSKKFLVKGTLNGDTGSYFVKVPQEIREFLDLKGGEYFQLNAKIKGEKKKISLKLVDIVEE